MLHSRIQRIESMLQVEIGRIIDQDLNDPNLPEFITVSRVKVSKDLSRALALITFLHDQTAETVERTVRELNHSSGFVTRLLAQRVQLKRHPKVKFAYSPTTKTALDMEHLFQKIKREDAERPHEETDEGVAED